MFGITTALKHVSNILGFFKEHSLLDNLGKDENEALKKIALLTSNGSITKLLSTDRKSVV